MEYSPLIDKDEDLYSKSSFFSKLLFLWTNPVIAKGYHQALSKEDFKVPSTLTSEVQFERLNKNWMQFKD